MSGEAAIKRLVIGSDHAGFAMKSRLLEYIGQQFPNIQIDDMGTFSDTAVNYPEVAEKVARKVAGGGVQGILICGTGIGMSIAANKIAGVRAAMAWNSTSARLSREHNDANVLCLGARLIGPEVACDVLQAWLTAKFQGGRHQTRVDLITRLEGQ